MVQGLIGQAACYGSSGGQVQNPANVITAAVAPSSNGTSESVGALYVNTATGNMYGLVGKSGSSATWTLLGGASAAISTLTGGSGGAISPSSGNITLAGTANQITTTGAGSTITWALASALTAPGSVTATTTLTATLGDITATNGNLVLGTAGNKLSIATGANASVGTSANLSGTPGTITISTTAVTASSIILLTRNTTGGTLGNLSAPSASIVAGTSFVINSDANETSTVNWMIIN